MLSRRIVRSANGSMRVTLRRADIIVSPSLGVKSLNTATFRRHVSTPLKYFAFPGPREFHSSPSLSSLMPDAQDPGPKESESPEQKAPAQISSEQYHEIADQYLEELNSKLEAMQESREDMEVEYSAGILSVTVPNKGTYVINKQPPNKQIWLSSPISGPKRYDYVVEGESQHEKEGGGVGDWIYIRDNSSLTQLLRKELGIELGIDPDTP
ncbi:Frataxin [Patellaria atrata CBS 101060]|uniref:ferroxidase n=1 Tax=Patellaria atrata CBS 101060 TaxID=1346257 RepID=A0A9P4SBW9_9PEZI|nr:Frataxin [Patellaria atrata CBS 101060]